jgi:hypothetical protein
MGGRCKTRWCQTSPVSQLKADHAEQNSLEAELMEAKAQIWAVVLYDGRTDGRQAG